MLNFEKNIQVFNGCRSSYGQARLVVFGAPFDCTTSFKPGTRFASPAMRMDSIGLETYSPYQDRDLTEIAVCDIGDVEVSLGDTGKTLDAIENCTARILADKKIPVMIGGEHLVTLGTMRAVAKVHPDVCVLHFDAHTDLRDIFLGEEMSHATVMRRVWDIIGDGRIYQFGIRSGDRSEFVWAREHVVTNRYNLEGLDEAVRKLSGRPVYVSIDLDVMDPSVFPGTGTPEPGGVSFQALLDGILSLKGLNIVGADVNELSPHYDVSRVSTMVACKVLRELLLVI